MTDLTTRTYGQWWQVDGEYVPVSLESLRRIGTTAYRAAGASEDDAAFLFATNLDKAIQGDHARGLGKVPGLIDAAMSGALDVHPKLEVVVDRPSAAIVDGGPKASGRLVCRFAMDLAIEKARQHGVAMVGARASGEILTPFVMQAAAADMVGLVFVQSVPYVAPLGGRNPMLGNAPVAVGVPAGRYDPVILDMSLTQTSASGVGLAAAQGEQLPPGMLLDERGEPTTDAAEFLDPAVTPFGHDAKGSLVPLGGNHKGYALVFIVGLLASVLTDTSPPFDLYYRLDERGRYGTVLMAIDPSVAMPVDAFKSRVDDYISRIKESPRRSGVDEILYPGEKSQALKARRGNAGVIAIPREDFEQFGVLAKRFDVPPPEVVGEWSSGDRIHH